MNLRFIDARTVGISLDETTTLDDVHALVAVFGATTKLEPGTWDLELAALPLPHARQSAFLTHPCSIRSMPNTRCCVISNASRPAIFRSATR